MKIAAGLKSAAKSLVAGPKAESFRAAGKVVECPHCENILFHKRKISLNTALSSFISLEWADREACVLVCGNCSRIEWFYDDIKSENA
jgi:predicted nucleic-acid-binding Zn-ribbon protein